MKYLLLHPANYDEQSILFSCQQNKIEALGEGYIRNLRTQLLSQVPDPFYPKDKTHIESALFLRQQGVYFLFFPDYDIERLFLLLERPRLREYVETALIAMARESDVAKALRDIFRFQCNGRTIEHYKMLFFDVDNLTTVELQALLMMQGYNLANHPQPHVASQQEAYKRAAYNDPRLVAARMPRGPFTATVAQIALGFMPPKMDVTKAMEQIQKMMLMQMASASMSSDIKAAEKLTMGVQAFVRIDEYLEKKGSSEERLREQMRAIQIKTEQEEVPLLSELSGGEHTLDVHKPINKTVLQTENFEEEDEDEGP